MKTLPKLRIELCRQLLQANATRMVHGCKTEQLTKVPMLLSPCFNQNEWNCNLSSGYDFIQRISVYMRLTQWSSELLYLPLATHFSQEKTFICLSSYSKPETKSKFPVLIILSWYITRDWMRSRKGRGWHNASERIMVKISYSNVQRSLKFDGNGWSEWSYGVYNSLTHYRFSTRNFNLTHGEIKARMQT